MGMVGSRLQGNTDYQKQSGCNHHKGKQGWNGCPLGEGGGCSKVPVQMVTLWKRDEQTIRVLFVYIIKRVKKNRWAKGWRSGHWMKILISCSVFRPEPILRPRTHWLKESLGPMWKELQHYGKYDSLVLPPKDKSYLLRTLYTRGKGISRSVWDYQIDTGMST